MKNEHAAFFPLEQDDVVNSLNCRERAVISLISALAVTDCMLALSQTK